MHACPVRLRVLIFLFKGGIMFSGTWKWEKLDAEVRFIKFIQGEQGPELRIYNGNVLWDDFRNLHLAETRGADGGDTGYIFHNGWLSPDGKKFFQCEISTGPESGNFVNAMEFEFVHENRLKQVLMGYRFDSGQNAWVHFREEVFLTRIEG